MKRLFLELLIILGMAGVARAQFSNTTTIRFAGVPSGTCAPFSYAVNNATGDFYDCLAGSWHAVGGGGGGSGTVTSVLGTANQITSDGSTTTPTLSIPSTFTFPGTVTNNLSIFGATTSAQLAGIISNETGSGLLVFGTSPTLVTPALGTPTALVLTNATGLPLSGLATQAADTLVMNATGGSASPTAVALPTSGTNGCAGAANALTYNTSTHALGCNSISAGSVTWDAITSPAGNQTLTMTGDSTTWNWGSTNTNQTKWDTSGNLQLGLVSATTAVTAAPTLTFQGSYQNAGTPTFAAETMTSALTLGSGTNGAPTQTWTLTGSPNNGTSTTTFRFTDASTTGGSSSDLVFRRGATDGLRFRLTVTPTSIIDGTNGALILQRNLGGFGITTASFVGLTLGGGISTDTFTATSGTQTGQLLTSGGGFAPTSGTAKFIGTNITNTINQTGGANGDYTALQVNTTETAAGGTNKLFLDLQLAGTSKFKVDDTGNTTSTLYSTATNCSNAAAPAVCAAAPAGVVAVPTGTNPTLTINTTAVTANSRIFLQIDESATIAATTCNTTLSTLVQPVVTARTAATSFTIQIGAVIAANPACVSYFIVN